MARPMMRWVALGAGTLAAFFSNGVSGEPLAVWLAPALLLGFVMTSGVWIGLAAMTAVWTAAGYVMFRGAVPMPETEFAVLSLIGGCLSALPYLLHRLAAPRLGGLVGSFVFPSVSTSLGYILSMGSPFGTWGHEAYMLVNFAALSQLSSVVGIWGITFLVMWAASVAVGLATARDRSAIAAAALFAVCFSGVIGFGAWRLQTPLDATPTVRVAALNNPADLPDKFFEGCGARDDFACRTAKARARWERLFADSSKAVRDGAKVVVWYEAAAQYDEHDEAEFIARAEAFVREHAIHLVVGAASVPRNPRALLENKAMLFTPDGALALTYHKAIPVPGEPIAPGDGRVGTLDTPFGRLGVMICFDADFPSLSRQAAARGVDILVVPANDWREITPLHGEMVRFRAIENGFAVVRAASNGLSILTDPLGRALARVNSFEDPGEAAMADVPAGRIVTHYGAIDDQFAGLASLAAIGLLLAALARALLSRKGRHLTGKWSG